VRRAESPYATLDTGGRFVAPIATGWSDPVPRQVFIPAVDQRLFTAHRNMLITLKPQRSSMVVCEQFLRFLAFPEASKFRTKNQ
jgi:hypothetical protein